MSSYLHILSAQFTWKDFQRFGRSWAGFGHDQEFCGKQLAEPAVYLADGCRRSATPLDAALVNPSLHLNMSYRFSLKIALLEISTVVTIHRPFYVDRVGIVALNQV